MAIKIIFLDRDGVINIDKNYLYKINDFEFIDGIFQACLHFQNLGFSIIIITNQSGISRGFYTKKEFLKLTKWMLLQFKKNNIDILDIFHCPHAQDSNCNCRKPMPGMFLEAQKKYNIDMKRSWMIGDRERDISAAEISGVTNTILINKIPIVDSKAKFITDSLLKVIKIIKH